MPEVNAGMPNPFAIIGRLMGEVAAASEKAGVTELELKGFKAKIEGGEKLLDTEKAKVKSFVEALIPSFQKIADEFGDDGAALANKMRGQFDELLAKVS